MNLISIISKRILMTFLSHYLLQSTSKH